MPEFSFHRVPTGLLWYRISQEVHLLLKRKICKLTHNINALTWIINTWKEIWTKTISRLHSFITNLESITTDHEYNRTACVRLNRIRTDIGRIEYLMHKWRLSKPSNTRTNAVQPNTSNPVVLVISWYRFYTNSVGIGSIPTERIYSKDFHDAGLPSPPDPVLQDGKHGLELPYITMRTFQLFVP